MNNQAIHFKPGKKCYAEIPNQKKVALNGDLTIEFWLCLHEWPQLDTDIISKTNNDEQSEFCLRIKNRTEWAWFYGDGEKIIIPVSFAADKVISLNKWYHIVLVRKTGIGGIIFINGKQAAKADWSGCNDPARNDIPVFLMGNPYKDRYLDGKLFNLRIWKTAKQYDPLQKGLYKEVKVNRGNLLGNWRFTYDETISVPKKLLPKQHFFYFDPATSCEFEECIQKGKFDFLDFGCSRGGSIVWSKKYLLGKHGLGIDIASNKVAEAREAGHKAILFDIHHIPDKPLVRFTIMAHFLEHVPCFQDVYAFIKKACIISKEFVFIRQPFFDADGYLLKNGLKLYWSDWSAHPNNMSTLNFYQILTKLKEEGLIGQFSIHGQKPIMSSASDTIHPLISPPNQHQYHVEKHPPKPMDIRFSYPVYYETVVFITKPGIDHSQPFKKLSMDETFFADLRQLDG